MDTNSTTPDRNLLWLCLWRKLRSVALESFNKKPTRGKGFLEPLLARLRSRQANLLIPEDLRRGRILDIGCGSYPYFLSNTYFKEKYAIERSQATEEIADINWYAFDFNTTPSLPFEENSFSVVTLLAVIEHIDPEVMVALFIDIHRILKPGGALIMTTPAAWSNNLLHWMSRVNLVSKEEIDEHVYAYTLPLLGWYLGKAGFGMDKVKFGYFELMFNLWSQAIK
jgi:SAM-dependent methyltransferase